jgi:AcrR family transcriptional regulator
MSEQAAVVESPREARRRLRIDTARTQILDAAERIFASSGFRDTTMKSIAEQCEIAVGTMYTLFEDKTALFEAVLRRRGAVLRELTERKAAEPGRGDTRLVELAELQIRFFRDHPDWTRLASMLMTGSRGDPAVGDMSRLYRSGHQVVADIHAEVIARGQRERTIRQGAPSALAQIFMGMLENFHALDGANASDGDFTVDEFLDLVRATFDAPGY